MSELTRRQRVILEMVAEGMTNREIADKLWVTESAVKFQLNLAYKKLGIAATHNERRAEAIAWIKEAA